MTTGGPDRWLIMGPPRPLQSSLNAAASRSRATRSGGGDVAQLADGAPQVAMPTVDPRWSEAIRTFKQDLLEQTPERTQGNRPYAARALGLQRTYLLKLIRELGMQGRRRGQPPGLRRLHRHQTTAR